MIYNTKEIIHSCNLATIAISTHVSSLAPVYIRKVFPEKILTLPAQLRLFARAKG